MEEIILEQRNYFLLLIRLPWVRASFGLDLKLFWIRCWTGLRCSVLFVSKYFFSRNLYTLQSCLSAHD